jgi:hypothetical protein
MAELAIVEENRCCPEALSTQEPPIAGGLRFGVIVRISMSGSP